MDCSFQDIIHLDPCNWTYDLASQLKDYVYRRSERAFLAGDGRRDTIKTADQIKARQKWTQKTFLASIGGLPDSSCALNDEVVGVIEQDGFRIEKVIFQSRSKVYVTANVYIPSGLRGRTAGILFACGHHQQAKHEPEYQIVCRYLVQAGFVVLAFDPPGQGERCGYYEPSLGDTTVRWGTLEHDYVGSQCLAAGDSLARYFLHDCIRALDYLCSRPEVDPKRVGMTGNSGGGTQTCMMMMADRRLAAAAPCTFLMSRQAYMYAGQCQDAEQIWPGLTALGWDHEDILLSMAPKPVCVLAAEYDFFPIEGTRRTVERARRYWRILGKPNYLSLVEDACRHLYSRPLAQAATRFFARHLLGKSIEPSGFGAEPIEPKQLWCTACGQVRGTFKDAVSVFDENRRRIVSFQKALPAKTKAVGWLKDKVFSDRDRCALNGRNYWSGNVEDCWVDAWLWRSQPEVWNAGMVFKSLSAKERRLPVTVALFEEGTKEIPARRQWLRSECQSGHAVLVAELTGVGSLLPHPLAKALGVKDFYGALHKLNCDLLWLNDSLAAIRIYDVIRAIDFCQQYLSVNAVRIATFGRMGFYAQFARLLDRRIKTVSAEDKLLMAWALQRHYNVDNIHSFILPGAAKMFAL